MDERIYIGKLVSFDGEDALFIRLDASKRIQGYKSANTAGMHSGVIVEYFEQGSLRLVGVLTDKIYYVPIDLLFCYT